jgi:CRP-like cAMP-binding protein
MSNIQNSAYYSMILMHLERRIQIHNEQKDLLIGMLKLRTILPRQYLLQQGDVCRYESFVCKGLLRSFFIDQKGQEHTLHFAMEDWWISDLRSFVNQEPATRNIIAVEPTVVLQIDLQHRDDLIRQVPAFERFWRILNEQAVISADSRIINDISLSGYERYEALIAKYPGIEQRLPQKHIASFLGITPVFLSQIRKEMVKR